MKNYKNHPRRNRFRNNGDRNYIRNGNNQKMVSDFTNSSNFKRKFPGKNNQNASKLIDKYTTLAKEALSNGDKILSENYFQHADHFTRILNDQDAQRKLNSSNNTNNSQKNVVDVNKEQNNVEEKKTISQIK